MAPDQLSGCLPLNVTQRDLLCLTGDGDIAQVTRIPKYEQWYQDFRQALSRLDAGQQQGSPLPIIEHWRHPLPNSRVTK